MHTQLIPEKLDEIERLANVDIARAKSEPRFWYNDYPKMIKTLVEHARNEYLRGMETHAAMRQGLTIKLTELREENKELKSLLVMRGQS